MQQIEEAAKFIELKKERHAKIHTPFQLRSDKYTIHKNSKGYELVYNRDHPATWGCLKVQATNTANRQTRASCKSKLCLMPFEIDQAEEAGVPSEMVRDILVGWSDCEDNLCSGRCYLQQEIAKAKARRTTSDLASSKKKLLRESRRNPLEYIDLMMGPKAPHHMLNVMEDVRLVRQDKGVEPTTWSHFELKWLICFDDRPSKRSRWEVEHERPALDEKPQVS